MKEIFEQFGVIGALVAIILIQLFNMWREIQKERNASKDKALDKNTAAIEKLTKDLNRYYFRLKFLAGDKWPQVSQFIQTEPQEKDQ